MGSVGERDTTKPGDAGPRQIATVAQHGYGVEIDGKLSGHNGLTDSDDWMAEGTEPRLPALSKALAAEVK
ncbi:MAG: hypothetical protein HoeaKO_20790 [Hoeflea alexandrii]